MAKYICERCSYQTSDKTRFENHLNRINKCRPNKLHGKIKNYVQPYCDICNKSFAQPNSLKTHNEKFHPTVDNSNIQSKNSTNITVNDSDNNTVTGIHGNNNESNIGCNNHSYNNHSHNTINIGTQNIYPIIIQPTIYPYNYHNIEDLSLFEQYVIITSKISPYTLLLDNLNLNLNRPQYNNIYYRNITKNIIDLHDGEKWIKGVLSISLDRIIISKIIVLKVIFNKFRIFFGNEAMKLIPYFHHYGREQNSDEYKDLAIDIKFHLYNNRNVKKKNDEKIPTDRNHKIWWAISKWFNWNEVDELITKMIELGTDFDKNLDDIKINILGYIEQNPHLERFFKKLLKRIDELIDDFRIFEENRNNGDSINEVDDFSSEEPFYFDYSLDDQHDENNDKSNDKSNDESNDESNEENNDKNLSFGSLENDESNEENNDKNLSFGSLEHDESNDESNDENNDKNLSFGSLEHDESNDENLSFGSFEHDENSDRCNNNKIRDCCDNDENLSFGSLEQ